MRQTGYTFSHIGVCSAILLVVAAAASPGAAIETGAVDQIAAAYEGRLFTLAADLHEPIQSSESMLAPMFDRKGWHHHDLSGPAVLRAGSSVEVAGVYNYAERGFFLELAREPEGFGREPVDERPRIRIRFMVESDASAPSGQVAEAHGLIDKLLKHTVLP